MLLLLLVMTCAGGGGREEALIRGEEALIRGEHAQRARTEPAACVDVIVRDVGDLWPSGIL